MDATTMVKTASLAKILAKTFPELTFVTSDDFRWSPSETTVYYQNTDDTNDLPTLLHETAHGLLGHTAYQHDVTLLRIERDAWSYVQQKLAPRFGVMISDDLVEDSLDSYRKWLHDRSLCPDCDQTGIQAKDDTYHCLGCNTTWRTNDARRCGLRRYRLNQTKTPAV